MNKLEVDSIHFSYGSNVILSDIYLQCKTSEVIGLVGRNGSGKSTLLKIILGVSKGQNQSIRLNDGYLESPYKVNGTVNYLPQSTFLPGEITFSQAKTIFKVRGSFPDIKQLEKIKLKKLSVGQRRLLETLIILYSPTKFSMLDEPFSFLSPKMIEQLIHHILHQKSKKGIILCDHLYRRVLEVSDTLYYLNSGSTRVVSDEKDLVSYGYLPSQIGGNSG